MAIRRMVYLACDECLNICDGSDADRAGEARTAGRARGWIRRDGRDVCLRCQGGEPCALCGRPGTVFTQGYAFCKGCA